MKTLIEFPTRRSDSDCPVHSLVMNEVMNARASIPSHLAFLIIRLNSVQSETIEAVCEKERS